MLLRVNYCSSECRIEIASVRPSASSKVAECLVDTVEGDAISSVCSVRTASFDEKRLRRNRAGRVNVT